MVCSFCGKENADDAVFCKACGNRLVSEEAPEELYTENISEEEYAESEEYASYAADSTENSVIVCANCGAANPAGDAFCGKCGKPFVSVCPKCGAKLADGQRFCGACGTAADGKSSATLGEAAGKFADYVKNISLPSSTGKINYTTILGGVMAVCVFLCAVAGPWFSIFGRSGGLFKVMQLGINFNDFMGYYMLSSGNGIGVIVVLVAGIILLLCGVSAAAFIMSVVNIIKGNGDYDRLFVGACGFGAVAAIIALLAAPLANAVIKSETGFDIKALSAEVTPWVLLVLCVLAFVLKKFVFDKLAEKAES